MNRQNIIVSDRSQMQKTTYYMIPFTIYELLQRKKIIRKFHPLEVNVTSSEYA